ncbi:hypothetical protein [Ninorex virus]|nr:hypothetical protein [Ninorex virus]
MPDTDYENVTYESEYTSNYIRPLPTPMKRKYKSKNIALIVLSLSVFLLIIFSYAILWFRSTCPDIGVYDHNKRVQEGNNKGNKLASTPTGDPPNRYPIGSGIPGRSGCQNRPVPIAENSDHRTTISRGTSSA